MALHELDRLQMHYIDNNIFVLKKSVPTNYEVEIVSYTFLYDRSKVYSLLYII